MSVQTKIDKEGIYFVTFTCYGWQPLIALSKGTIRGIDRIKIKLLTLAAYVELDWGNSQLGFEIIRTFS